MQGHPQQTAQQVVRALKHLTEIDEQLFTAGNRRTETR